MINIFTSAVNILPGARETVNICIGAGETILISSGAWEVVNMSSGARVMSHIYRQKGDF